MFDLRSNSLTRFALRTEKQWAAPILLFAFLYFAVTALHASRKFWYDELFTYYTARLPDFATIWASLKDGADLNPPLLYAATRLSHSLFGDGVIATRAPAMAGFLLMCLSLCAFVSRRCGRSFGLAAMTLPVLTGAYMYSAEARSYGMVLGFSAACGLCWQLAAEGIHRKWTIPAMALLLAAALLTHTYATLLLVAFGAAEVARALVRRRIDLPLLAALIAPVPCVLVYLPMLAALRGFILNTSLFRPSVAALLGCYNALFAPAVWPVLIGAVLVAFWAALRNQTDPAMIPVARLPLHELVFAVVLLAMPILAAVIAALITGVFMSRYGLASVIGFSILACSFASWATRRSSVIGVALFLTFLGSFCVKSGLWLHDTLYGPSEIAVRAKPALDLAALPGQMPLVISNGLLLLEADHYEKPEIVSRLYFLTDRTSALSYTGTDVFDKGYSVLQKWFPIRGHIMRYRDFLITHKRFLIIGSYQHVLEWVPRKLVADGVQLTLVGEFTASYGDVLVLEGSFP